MRPLVGKTALVTGAARGIGKEIALRLAAKRMRLALADRDVQGLAAACRSVERLGVEVVACPCELAEPGEVERLAGLVLDRWAGVDLLVNNAGIAHYGPTHEADPAATERLLRVNLLVPIRLTQLLLTSMLARPEAHVLNVSSVLGLVPMPKMTAYSASKQALIAFSESLRREYARAGLGVTTLCPGFVQTPLLADAMDPHAIRRPPAVLCVSADRVAAAAVRGIELNRRRVVVDPVGRVVRGTINALPTAFDWLYTIGRGRRVARKERELSAISDDRETALRLRLGLGEAAPRRAA